MLLSARAARRALAGGLGAGAVAGAMLCGAVPSAVADPPAPPAPPASPAPAPPSNCTAADLAGVSAGVSASTSAYLFSHPDVNAFFTGLRGQPKSAIKDTVQNYLNANPQVKSDLQGIRQPLIDLKNRCGGASA
ncbi:MAG: heme-binding protein [Mycobacteriaceae bacterium]|nr:heme-binding protein [Mycobacteriaceae bacterium]MBV9638922.1 heme-binding protein [Mycobacteriaceae bacterium]